jgi:hypothetical protein
VTVARRTLRTFDNQSGRNVFYRAAIHPMAAPLTAHLVAAVAAAPSVAVYDPLGYFGDLAAIYDLSGWTVEGVYVQRLEEVGRERGGFTARPLTDLVETNAEMIFVAAFDGMQVLSRLGPYKPVVEEIQTLDAIRLDPHWLTKPGHYLDPLNFVSDFMFFRDADGLHTRISTVNYWHRHGAEKTRLWCRLFDAAGNALASWDRELDAGECSILFDSAEIRHRFGLGDFTGSLFVHVIGAAAHDTLKYAVDLFDDSGETATATHDSNPWPADFYAGLPAAAPGEAVRLWVQNCYPTAIPAGAVAFRPMGGDAFAASDVAIPPYGTAAIDIGAAFPAIVWPGQFEIRADKYFCRPRYEITRANHRSVAHVNVERGDLKPAADLPEATRILGKGFILPGPLLPTDVWTTTVVPTPMATWQDDIALTLRIYDHEGAPVAEHPLGRRARGDQPAVAIDDLLAGAPAFACGYGHIELGYDFAAGGNGDGWLHAIFRVAERHTGRSAETSFGSHLFNVPAIWRNEPNSYLGKPPGLTTRLFLRLNGRPGRTMCHLIYPTSGRWLPLSDTALILHAQDGTEIARETVAIPCSGSRLLAMREVFEKSDLAGAEGGYVIIRDSTCRLFGYHVFLSDGGGIALDHMFGF